MFLLSKELFFPPVEIADEDGLLAIGGDLSTERLLLAYYSGIFPWYNEDEPTLLVEPRPTFCFIPCRIENKQQYENSFTKWEVPVHHQQGIYTGNKKM